MLIDTHAHASLVSLEKRADPRIAKEKKENEKIK